MPALLDERGDEAELAAALSTCVHNINDSGGIDSEGGGEETRLGMRVQLCEFDFHMHCSRSRADGLRELLQRLNSLQPEGSRPAAHGFYAHIGGAPKPSRFQVGIVRTNCLDCLNRTNMAQTVLALQSASEQLRGLCRACGVGDDRASAGLEATVQAALRKLWAETGDAISIQYTGTSNLSKGSNITGDAPKKSMFDRASGLVEKGVKTVNRYVHEQFLEDTKQAAIDALLGAGQPRMQRTRSARTSRVSRTSCASQPLSIFVGTWNNNGKLCSADDLRAWLTEPASKLGGAEGGAEAPLQPGGGSPGDSGRSDEGGAMGSRPAMYVVGFQEFVDLTAKNLISDDASRRKECRSRLEGTLRDIHGEGYVPVCVEQMFGIFLLVYVRPWLAAHVRGVVADSCRCGFGSDALGVKAGNKGGVSVRLEVLGATLCIVNTHLPAGQSHPEERNATYGEVLKGLAQGFATVRATVRSATAESAERWTRRPPCDPSHACCNLTRAPLLPPRRLHLALRGHRREVGRTRRPSSTTSASGLATSTTASSSPTRS